MSEQPVEYVTGVILRETEKALLLKLPEDESGREVWIPRSVVTDGE